MRTAIAGKRICSLRAILRRIASPFIPQSRGVIGKAGDCARLFCAFTTMFYSIAEGKFKNALFVYFFSNFVMWSIKLLGSKTKLKYGIRPSCYLNLPQGIRYDGFLSGHTGSTALTASMMRRCFNKRLSILLYLCTLFNGYSRLRTKDHKAVQVLLAILFAEAEIYAAMRLRLL